MIRFRDNDCAGQRTFRLDSSCVVAKAMCGRVLMMIRHNTARFNSPGNIFRELATPANMLTLMARRWKNSRTTDLWKAHWKYREPDLLPADLYWFGSSKIEMKRGTIWKSQGATSGEFGYLLTYLVIYVDADIHLNLVPDWILGFHSISPMLVSSTEMIRMSLSTYLQWRSRTNEHRDGSLLNYAIGADSLQDLRLNYPHFRKWLPELFKNWRCEPKFFPLVDNILIRGCGS